MKKKSIITMSILTIAMFSAICNQNIAKADDLSDCKYECQQAYGGINSGGISNFCNASAGLDKNARPYYRYQELGYTSNAKCQQEMTIKLHNCLNECRFPYKNRY